MIILMHDGAHGHQRAINADASLSVHVMHDPLYQIYHSFLRRPAHFPTLMASADVAAEPDAYRARPLSAAPSVVSIAPGPIRPYVSQRPGPSISARTSFTRVGPDDEEGPLFPARPATASAAMAVPQLQLLRPRLFDLPSAGSVSSFRSDADEGGLQPGEESELPLPQETAAAPVASSSSISAPSPPHQPQPTAVPQTPQTFITFLLVTGKRRTMSFDPETTIGRVKELVWNTWPEGVCVPIFVLFQSHVTTLAIDNEWQSERPPAPSYLRLLYLGKMLQDDDTLTSAFRVEVYHALYGI